MNTTMKPVPRSMLFTPATKASHFDKAAEVGAAAVILDLEDSVPTAAKDQARRAALNYLGSDRPSGVQTALRINAPATLAGWQDLTALVQSSCDPDFVVIPKAESAAVAGLVKSLLAQVRKAARVVVIYESARAVTHIGALLDPRVVDAVMLGGDDMSADLGADGQAEVTAYARNVLLTHASAVAIPVIDSPFFDISDDVGLGHAARRAVAEGFAGKAAIHPRQIPVINAAFRPDEREIDWAREVIKANRAGVGTVAGVMVDEAVARHARRILQRLNH
jgi:(S)-citramalyl-CoA lyase